MANEGSPNPSAIIVNLSEDTRQSDPEKLKVTAFPVGVTEGMLAFTDEKTIQPEQADAVVTRNIPPKTRFRVKGFDGYADADGVWELKIDGKVVAISATSAAQRVAEKTFEPPFRVEEGKTALLSATNKDGTPATFRGVLRGWDEAL